jgi:predicted RNase H-like nuclease (RuvC/YqgF family)
MKLFRLILITVAACLFSLTGFAKEDYTLPSGRVLKDAYIMERKPNGVTVGHSTGVMFVKYDQMSKKLREELGYDADKCAKYEAKVRKHKKAKRKRAAAEQAKSDQFHKELKVRQGRYRINELENKIKATELRIKRLKMEIPKLEEDTKDYLNKAVSLSGSSGGGYSTTSNLSGSIWGSSSSSGRNRNSYRTEVKDRYKAAKAVGEEYSKSKFRLSNAKDELERKILQLDKMKAELAELKKKQGKAEGKKGNFLSNLF